MLKFCVLQLEGRAMSKKVGRVSGQGGAMSKKVWPCSGQKGRGNVKKSEF